MQISNSLLGAGLSAYQGAQQRVDQAASAIATASLPTVDSSQALTEISEQLIELKVEHRDLDEVIGRLAASIEADELAIKRLKKRKLKIKDMIAALESRLIPDLDA